MKINSTNTISFGALYTVKGYERAVKLADVASNRIVRASQINKKLPKDLYLVGKGEDAGKVGLIKSLFKLNHSRQAKNLLKQLLAQSENL